MDRLAIGIDIGGTKIALGVVNSAGVIESSAVFPSDVELGGDEITMRIIEHVEVLREGFPSVSAIGIGMAGQMDRESGVVYFAPNLHWKNFPLKEKLKEKIDLPISIINDVRAATWGEWMFGAGRGLSDLVCIFVGTGIGGGIICEGKIIEGASNSGGEIGHIVIDMDGPPCACGGQGCLEAFAGGLAIGKSAARLVEVEPSKGAALLHLCKGDPSQLTAKMVRECAMKADPLSIQIMEKAASALVAGVTSIVNALNPACVILGGGVIEGNRGLIEIISAGVRKRALKAASKNLIVKGTDLKNEAGLIGAAYYALSSA